MTLLASSPPAEKAVLNLAARVLAFDPLESLRGAGDRRVENGVVPVVLFVVAMIVLLALAAAVSIAVLIFCSQKGMNFEWYVKTSLFEVKVACKR